MEFEYLPSLDFFSLLLDSLQCLNIAFIDELSAGHQVGDPRVDQVGQSGLTPWQHWNLLTLHVVLVDRRTRVLLQHIVVNHCHKLFISEFSPGQRVVIQHVSDQAPLIAKYPVVPIDNSVLSRPQVSFLPRVVLIIAKFV
jgi:hypothetical protein